MKDYDRLFSQAYRNLAPGGYFEIVSIHLITTSDDGTHLNAKNFVENHELIYEASRKFGKVLKTGPEWKDKLIKAGFVDVHEKISKVGWSTPIHVVHVTDAKRSRAGPPESLAQGP